MAADGSNATGHSYQPSLSDDGRFVAFESEATNLDPFGRPGVFLRDREQGTTTWLTSGRNPVISGDGRTVVFSSYGDAGYLHAYALDVVSGDIEMLDVTPTGGHPGPYNGGAGPMSYDGRYVLLGSASPHLVAGDNNNFVDGFVRDRVAGTTERVTLSHSGGELPAVGGAGACDISSDGRFVAFSAEANGVVPGDGNNRADVFVRDREQGTVEIVSVSDSGALGDAYSGCGSINGLSADGNLVTFHSHSTNFGAGSSDAVYLRDRAAQTTRRVSETVDGAAANSASRNPQLSADGRFVTFLSWATNLVADGPNVDSGVFVRDLATGAIERANVSTDGEPANASAEMPTISGDGRFVAFVSRASNLTAGDTDSCTGYERDRDDELQPFSEHCIDVFLRDRGPTAANSAAGPVVAGGAVSTNTTVSDSDPVGTSVTSPVAGTVSIVEGQATDAAPSGYSFISGQQVNIEAPQATAEDPLELVFRLDDSVLPAGADASSLEVFRDGVAIGDCSGPAGTATPDPCIAARTALDGGGVQLTILTSHASHWNFGLHDPYAFGGMIWPSTRPAYTYRAGSTVPVRFSLGGDFGRGILASGYPRSRACGSSGQGDAATGTLRYDSVKRQYVYTWATAKAWATASGGGPCREFILSLNDGSRHSREVRFVR